MCLCVHVLMCIYMYICAPVYICVYMYISPVSEHMHFVEIIS
jgi:hypothetical protein